MAKIDLADKLGDARARVVAEQTEPALRSLPKFARLTRKEARVREDQYAALSALARTLMRRRTVKSERITENTLIRVAIDVLLMVQQHLAGGTEAELRNSVTRALTDSQTSGVRDLETSEVRHSRSAEHPKPATAEHAEPGTAEQQKSVGSGLRGFRSSSAGESPSAGVPESRTTAVREAVTS